MRATRAYRSLYPASLPGPATKKCQHISVSLTHTQLTNSSSLHSESVEDVTIAAAPTGIYEIYEREGGDGFIAFVGNVHVFTSRSLLLYNPLKREIQRLAAHLPGEHEQDFDLARRPYQRYVGDAEALGHESEPGAEVGEAVSGVLWGLERGSRGE